jgi:hypothetical protein
VVDAHTGQPADPILCDRRSGRPLTDVDFVLAPGPAADATARRRLAAAAGLRQTIQKDTAA